MSENYITQLKFYGHPDSGGPWVTPSALAALTDALALAFERSMACSGIKASVHLDFHVSPSHGSLIIRLSTWLKAKPTKPNNKRGPWPDAANITAWAAVAMLGWTVCFGENGLLDLALQGQTAAPSGDAQADELRQNAGQMSSVTNAMLDVLAKASRTGASRVELEVPGGGKAVVIYDNRERPPAPLIRIIGVRSMKKVGKYSERKTTLIVSADEDASSPGVTGQFYLVVPNELVEQIKSGALVEAYRNVEGLDVATAEMPSLAHTTYFAIGLLSQ